MGHAPWHGAWIGRFLPRTLEHSHPLPRPHLADPPGGLSFLVSGFADGRQPEDRLSAGVEPDLVRRPDEDHVFSTANGDQANSTSGLPGPRGQPAFPLSAAVSGGTIQK